MPCSRDGGSHGSAGGASPSSSKCPHRTHWMGGESGRWPGKARGKVRSEVQTGELGRGEVRRPKRQRHRGHARLRAPHGSAISGPHRLGPGLWQGPGKAWSGARSGVQAVERRWVEVRPGETAAGRRERLGDSSREPLGRARRARPKAPAVGRGPAAGVLLLLEAAPGRASSRGRGTASRPQA